MAFTAAIPYIHGFCATIPNRGAVFPPCRIPGRHVLFFHEAAHRGSQSSCALRHAMFSCRASTTSHYFERGDLVLHARQQRRRRLSTIARHFMTTDELWHWRKAQPSKPRNDADEPDPERRPHCKCRPPVSTLIKVCSLTLLLSRFLCRYCSDVQMDLGSAGVSRFADR